MISPPLRVLVVCTAIVAAAATGAGRSLEAFQTDAGRASIQERLNRVGTDLFSGATRVDEAVRELKAILALDPRLPEGHLLLGMAYRMLGSADLMGEAKAELVQALALKPDLVPARSYLAQLYLDLGRAGGARDTLEAGLVLSPGLPQLLALLGEAERQLGNPRRSVELNRQALQADESFAQARYYLALALVDLGQREEAITELERVVRSGPKTAEPYLALGTAYMNAGRVDEALDALRLGTTIDSSRPDIRITTARAYRLKSLPGNADEQLQLALPEGTAALASPFSQQQVESDFYLELGLVRMQQGRLEAAAQAFQKVLDMESSHALASRHLAEVRRLLQERPRKGKSGGRQ